MACRGIQDGRPHLPPAMGRLLSNAGLLKPPHFLGRFRKAISLRFAHPFESLR